MSSRQFLIDEASFHVLSLIRYSNARSREASKEIRVIFRDLTQFILQDQSLEFIESFLSDSYGSLTDKILRDAEELGENELDFSQQLLNAATIPTAVITESTIDVPNIEMRMIENEVISISSALSQYDTKKQSQIIQSISDATLEGKTSREIARDVNGLSALHQNQASSLIRTVTNATSVEARLNTIAANDDIVDGYEWVSTLDNRTSHICMARDGVVYLDVKGSPKPPAHWSCRSTIIPKVNPAFDLGAEITGTRPSVGADGGQSVGANTKYSGFLRGQPASFQDKALGVTRAKLFRYGGLSVVDFVNNRGRTLTIKELRAKFPRAFELANVA